MNPRLPQPMFLTAANFVNSFCCCCSVANLCLTLLIPWTAAHQASLSFTISQILFKLMSIESVMPFSHLALCRSLLLLPSIFASIRVFSLIPAILSGSGSSFSLFLFGDEVLLESLDLKDLHLTCFPWGVLLQNDVCHEAVSL